MEKASLVLELQRLAQDSDTRIAELLRRAKVVASKLGLSEARTWIDNETNGYKSAKDVPAYREISSELRQKHPYRGWQPVLWEGANPLQEHFSKDKLMEPIAEIESFIGKEGVFHTRLDQSEIDILRTTGNAELFRFEVARVYPPAAFVRVVEAVRAKVLDFALDLEQKGILGEGMTFNAAEKRVAGHVTFNVASVGTLVHGDHANAPATTHSPGSRIDQSSASYTAGQAGAQGPHAVARDNLLAQGLAAAWSTATQKLVLRELGNLRSKLAKRIENADDAMELGRVGQVEDAVNRGDLSAVAAGLQSFGSKTRKLISDLKLRWLLTQI